MHGNTAHFHIRWIHGETSTTDWEPYPSRDEAETMAKLLKTPSESYVVDEFYDPCGRCAVFRLSREISHSLVER
jgi:hypothetical protein